MRNRNALGVLLLSVVIASGLAAQSAQAFSFNRFDPKVRVVHASPDAPAVDVIVNDALTAFSGIGFEETTDYATLDKGRYNFKVVPQGLTSPVVIDADVRLKQFRDYTLVATGRLAEIEPLVIEDRRFFISPRKASVRFVHASPDAPAVDITLPDGTEVFEDSEFRDVSRYFRVGSGTYDLQVRLAGTDTVVLEVPGVPLERGTAYTVFATGLVEDGSLNALLVEDRESPWKQYFIRKYSD